MTFRLPSAAAEGVLYAALVAAPLAFGCVEPWSRAILELLIFGVTALCLFRGAGAPLPPGCLAAVAALLIVGLLQRLHPSGPLDPRRLPVFTVAPKDTEEALLLWLAYGALLWAAPKALDGPAAARRLAWSVFVAGVLVAAVGIVQKICGADKLYGVRYIGEDASPFGPYYNRDHAASLMAMSLCVGAGIFHSRLRFLRPKPVRAVPPHFMETQAGIGALLILLSAGLGLCASRGAYLALAAAGAVLLFCGTRFMKSRDRRCAVYAGIVLAFGLAMVLISLNLERGMVATGVLEPSVANRISIYRDAARLVRDSPWFGWGLGGFGRAFAAYQDPSIVGGVEHAHNDWLELAAEAGLAGTAVWALAVAATIFGAMRVWWTARSFEMRSLIAGVLGAAIVFVVHGLVDFSAQIPANMAVFAALLAWLAASRAWADKSGVVAAPPSVAVRATRWAAFPGLLAAMALAVRPAMAGWYGCHADMAKPPARAVLLARAFTWDERPQYLYRLAFHYFYLGEDHPTESAVYWRRGLAYSAEAVRREPLNPAFLLMNGVLLWRLGRVDDAREFIERAQLARFDRLVPNRTESDTERVRKNLDALRRLNLLPDDWRAN